MFKASQIINLHIHDSTSLLVTRNYYESGEDAEGSGFLFEENKFEVNVSNIMKTQYELYSIDPLDGLILLISP